MNHLPLQIISSNVTNFDETCLEVFRFQYRENQVYRNWCEQLGVCEVDTIGDIPFLPVEVFKTKEVKAFSGEPEKLFYSSATGGNGRSIHPVKHLDIYEDSLSLGFSIRFGEIRNRCILGLLPSYLDREGSSLVYMVQHLVQQSGHALNGFFLYDRKSLLERLQLLEEKKEPYFLFGVSFALLDLANEISFSLNHATILETGGMKGRKKEITRNELLTQLKTGLGCNNIFSEYGMTELLSQAYSDENGKYHPAPWMRVSAVELNDPFTPAGNGKTGRIRIIDLANYYSCSFLLTSDIGKVFPDGSFEILGRMDSSELRGCSLLAVQ